MRPDGCFVLRAGRVQARLLVEIDRGTEDNPRFARETVRPAVAYLRSDAYLRRFGSRSGRWLVVTTGARRMGNMKRQTELALGKDARLFYFTTFDRVTPETLLSAPIWHRGGDETAQALTALLFG